MESGKTYYVYILTNRSGTLYVGVTNNMYRRLEEHRSAKLGSFSGKYKMDRLLYVEATNDVEAALNREKQIKGWTRARKIALFTEQNPRWRDISEDWSDQPPRDGIAQG